jgi:hypothetical protein
MDIIIPHSEINGYRARNLKYTLNHYWKNTSDNKIILSEQNTRTTVNDGNRLIHNRFETDSEFFCKSILINQAVALSNSGKLMLLDNDCILDKDALASIEADMGDADIFIPFTTINFLNEAHTRQLVRDGKFIQARKPPSMNVNRYTGGVVCFTRKIFDEVGGFDQEIEGWGKEDDAFMTKCKRLNAKIKRSDDDHELLHMFHPKVNNKEYMNSKRYRLNSEMLAVLKRMTDLELAHYIGKKKEGSRLALTEATDFYRDLGKLNIKSHVQCGDGSITIDTSAYTVTPDKDGRIDLSDILEASYIEDGLGTLSYVIKLVERTCPNISPEETEILEKYKSYFETATPT